MNSGITMRRLPSDEPYVTELPEGTTARDWPKFYAVMSYANFLALLPQDTEPNLHA